MRDHSLKRVLVPIWNRAHHGSRIAAEQLDALIHRRWEHCFVCGRTRLMRRRPRVVAPRLARLWNLTPELTEALVRKESLECGHCRAKLRTRRLAQVILERFPPDGARLASIRDWVGAASARALQVAEINRIEGLHEFLLELPGLACSDFHDPNTPGAFDAAARHEDLSALSYADGRFDLVLTSETLEHVPDLDCALREIQRVLRPGGWHLFTVPLLPGVARTYARARLDDQGRFEPLAPVIRHPGGDTGYPVFTEFGADLPELLDRAGFDTEVEFSPLRATDLAQVWACRKR